MKLFLQRYKKLLVNLLKVSILLLTIAYIAIELMHRNALENMGQITAQIQSGQRLYLLALVVILMPLHTLELVHLTQSLALDLALT